MLYRDATPLLAALGGCSPALRSLAVCRLCLKGMECQASKLVDRKTRPRPTTGGGAARGGRRARRADGGLPTPRPLAPRRLRRLVRRRLDAGACATGGGVAFTRPCIFYVCVFRQNEQILEGCQKELTPPPAADPGAATGRADRAEPPRKRAAAPRPRRAALRAGGRRCDAFGLIWLRKF